MALTIAALLARAAIHDCLNRYAQGVDQRNWPLFLSAFAPGAVVVVQGYLAAPITPEGFAALLRDTFDHNRLSGQHLLGNTALAVEGARAHAVTEFLATTLEEGAAPATAARQITAGLYVDDLVCGDDGHWRIARRTLARKSSNEDQLPFLPPVADAVRATLRAGWPLASPTGTPA
ncbi:MAG TPA: nuclear transport factor 2 family protein [Novosphingobium sp.]|nr:nuclear transport factor 2 family protein [Novosphingobium sp.]HZV11528.1 nuclear transport factor 2 family protein [Novosphingobium sp.]